MDELATALLQHVGSMLAKTQMSSRFHVSVFRGLLAICLW